MPKCRKRRICREPDYVIFQSENGLDDVTTLTVDEYEAIRQIDMEGLSQEECAKKMCVARTTAQLIYNSARKKIAESIVLGKSIRRRGIKHLCRFSHRDLAVVVDRSKEIGRAHV